ncbi:hypothetical protein T12_8070 [Trichinella patagoniensis]|uniref:Uncharacterized protein n=1 Tax=Trichinella patagoniensis TaxID=990121 RepID=A0A0V0ZCT4_9BILA|nr:hypothetical protein T12_8070 [Trichinella patagoniensis]
MDLCCDCCGQSVVNRLDLVQAQWSTATQPRLGKQKTYSNWLMHLIVHWSLATHFWIDESGKRLLTRQSEHERLLRKYAAARASFPSLLHHFQSSGSPTDRRGG